MFGISETTTPEEIEQAFITKVRSRPDGLPYATFALIKSHVFAGEIASVNAVLSEMNDVLPSGTVIRRLPMLLNESTHNAFMAEFYKEHADKPWWADIMESVQAKAESYCSVPLLIESRSPDIVTIFRQCIGATDAKAAEYGTLRSIFGGYAHKESRVAFNAFHGSDSPESADREYCLYLAYLCRNAIEFCDVTNGRNLARALSDTYSAVINSPVMVASTGDGMAPKSARGLSEDYTRAIRNLILLATQLLVRRKIGPDLASVRFDPGNYADTPILVSVIARSLAAAEEGIIDELCKIEYVDDAGVNYKLRDMACIRVYPPGSQLSMDIFECENGLYHRIFCDPDHTKSLLINAESDIWYSLHQRGVESSPAILAAITEAAYRVVSRQAGMPAADLRRQLLRNRSARKSS